MMDLISVLLLRNIFLIFIILMKGAQTMGEIQAINADTKDFAKLERDVAKLNRELQNVNLQNKEIIHQNEELRAYNRELVTKLTEMDMKYKEMKQWQNDIKAEHTNTAKSQIQTTFAAFTATPSERRIYQSGETIIFDTVLNNVGAYYDKDSSTFTCPVNGYYFFIVNVMNYPGAVGGNFHEMGAAIMLNGNAIGIHALSLDLSQYHQSTNGGVILCKMGDTVTTTASWSTTQTLNYGPYSSFSGWLLSLETVEP